jgi:hypothetical protein
MTSRSLICLLENQNGGKLQNYNLRDPFKFKINRCRTHKTYNTIFFRGLSMYNMLPLQLKECNNLLRFKVHLRQYFKENIVIC